MKNFDRPEITDDIITDIGRGSFTRFPYKVRGFWSHDSISVYVSKNYFGSDKEFKYEISCSSGGRDTDEVKLDEEAYLYKAEALQDACELIKILRENENVFIAEYKAYQEELKIAAAKEREEERLRAEADPLVTDIIAKILVKNARDLAKDDVMKNFIFKVRKPGKLHPHGSMVISSKGIKYNHKAVGLKEAIKILQEEMSISSANEAREKMFNEN